MSSGPNARFTGKNSGSEVGWLGLYRDNGKEKGNHYSTIGFLLGLYRDNEKENGNYYSMIGYILWLYKDYKVMEKKTKTTSPKSFGCPGSSVLRFWTGCSCIVGSRGHANLRGHDFQISKKALIASALTISQTNLGHTVTIT